jgi:hypothetical protein
LKPPDIVGIGVKNDYDEPLMKNVRGWMYERV